MNFMQKSLRISENFAISLSQVDTWLEKVIIIFFRYLAHLAECQGNIKSQSPKKVEEIFKRT